MLAICEPNADSPRACCRLPTSNAVRASAHRQATHLPFLPRFSFWYHGWRTKLRKQAIRPGISIPMQGCSAPQSQDRDKRIRRKTPPKALATRSSVRSGHVGPAKRWKRGRRGWHRHRSRRRSMGLRRIPLLETGTIAGRYRPWVFVRSRFSFDSWKALINLRQENRDAKPKPLFPQQKIPGRLPFRSYTHHAVPKAASSHGG